MNTTNEVIDLSGTKPETGSNEALEIEEENQARLVLIVGDFLESLDISEEKAQNIADAIKDLRVADMRVATIKAARIGFENGMRAADEEITAEKARELALRTNLNKFRLAGN